MSSHPYHVPALGDYMLRLPQEVFLEGIVGYLRPRDLQQLDTAFTNRLQRPLLRNLWKSYHYLTPDDHHISLAALKWLVDIGADVVGVCLLKGDSRVNPISFVSSNIPFLKRLDFACHEAWMSDDVLIQLARGCSQLEELIFDEGELVSDVGIMTLAQHCPKLHTISLEFFRNITDACILALCEHCLHIQHISLMYCARLSDAALIAIANSYPKLQSFEIAYNPEMITERSLSSLAANCCELRKVGFSNAGVALSALWAANPHLIDINLSCSRNYIIDADVVSLAQLCPKIQRVSIINCNDTAVIALAEHCPNLTTLKIGHCPNITDAALIALTEHCPNLTALSIGHCRKITDAALIALGSHSHCLRSLNISYNKNWTVDGMTALAVGCPLLQEVKAYDSCFDSACVIALVTGCHDLRKLDLSCCKDIGLSAISAIARNCPLITWLNLSHTDVDEACLVVIAEHCRFLTHLGAPRVDNE